MIKVTVKKSKAKKNINFKELPIGTVVEFNSGVKAIVYFGEDEKELLLIEYGNPEYPLAKSKVYTDGYSITKVLGTLAGIKVEE